MTAHLSRHKKHIGLGLILATAALSLGACATMPGASKAHDKPLPITATEQYPLVAETNTRAINLRINPNGFSDNQRRALDQVASQASWMSGEPVDVEILTSGNPASVVAGHHVEAYLNQHDVNAQNVAVRSVEGQPADIVTLNLVSYRARTYDCNETWENIAKTANNQPYANYGCAVTSNLAAQIADPRDLNHAQAATSTDADRKAVIMDHYRKGEVTSSATDDAAKGTISDAIK